MGHMARDKTKPARKKPSRKKPSKQATRNKSPKKFDFKNPTMQQLETVFLYWFACNRNITKTTVQFGISRNGLKAVITRYDWNPKYEAAARMAFKGTEKKAANALAKNVQTAQKILDRIGDKLTDKSQSITGDAFAFVRVAKYIDEVSGDTPQSTARDIIINVIQQITEAAPDERNRFARNYLAGLGIFDDAAVERMSAILPGKLHSQN